MKPEACFQFYKYLLSGSGESFAQHSNQKYFKQDFILSTVSAQQKYFHNYQYLAEAKDHRRAYATKSTFWRS